MRAALRSLTSALALCWAVGQPAPPAVADEIEPTPEATASPTETQRAPLEARVKLYTEARAAQREGRIEAARAGFQRASDELPELADYALFAAAGLANDAGDAPAARGLYDKLLGEQPDSVFVAAAAVERGRIALQDGDAALASRSFERAIRAADPTVLDEAKLGRAQALLASGALRGAYEAADELRGRPGRVGAEAREMNEGLEGRGAAALGFDPIDLALRVGKARLREGRSDAAREALAPVLASERPERGEALIVVARIRVAQGATDDARRLYHEAAAGNSSPATAGTALFESGRMAWNKNDDDSATQDFEQLLSRFPTHDKGAEALYALGRIAETRGDFERAAQQFAAVATRFPNDPLASDCAWRAGFARFLGDDTAAAATAFAALGERDDALYWGARALQREGDPGGARDAVRRLRERSPYSYFNWWIERGDRDAPDTPPAKIAVGLPPDALVPPKLEGPAAYHQSRATLLRTIGLRPEAARELAAVEAQLGPTAFLLEAYRGVDATPAMIRLARRLEDGGTSGLDAYLFPRAYSAEFERAGRAAGVDPLLLAAVGRQESLFDAAARSTAGARGVMQLMPQTAANVAGTPVDDSSLTTPSRNIELGARYLRAMIDRYDGRVVPAIAAYNAGPDAVARWQARAGERPGDEFVELISFRETRQYVKSVLRNYRAYRALNGAAPSPAPKLY